MPQLYESTRVYNSNWSRRQFLGLLGWTGVGLAAGMTVGCRSSTTPGVVDLLLYGTGTLDIEDWSRLQRDLNIKLKFKDNGNDTGPVITQMITGTAAEDYDIGGLQGGAEPELADAGVILPWDLDKIPNWRGIWPLARKIAHLTYQGRQYGIPIAINADSIIYLPDKVGKVDSYARVFDPELKGKTSMEDAWINSVIFTAIYLKNSGIFPQIKDPGNLMPDELKEVVGFLITKKKAGQFRKFWNGWEDGLQLIKSGEVWVMTGWEPIVYAAQKAGVKAEYAIPKEGYEGWSNDLILHRGAQTRGLVEAAHQFVNWELGGYYGCKLSTLRGYVVPTDKAVEYADRDPEKEFDPHTIEKTAKHVQTKIERLGGEVYWQNVRPTHYKLYEEWWSKLRSA